MRNSGFDKLPNRAAIGLLCAVLMVASLSLAGQAKKKQQTDTSDNAVKNKTTPGVNDRFKGIMNPANQVTMSDPLWERYAYAGKKALERHDIESAQRYYWASCFQLEDLAAKTPDTKVNDVGKTTLSDALALSNDVFFQDANASMINEDMPTFPQPLLTGDATRVDAEQATLVESQSDFDKQHPDFDGGARLRMVHLRRRIEFCSRLKPVVTKLFSDDRDIVNQVNYAYDSDTREYKDISTEG